VATISDQQHSTLPANAAAADAAAPEDTGVASLDKVRDILFGGQMRDLDRRFARVEDRLTQEAAALEEQLRKRIAALESFARTETEALSQRLESEHAARRDANAELTRGLQDRAAELERRAAALDDQIARVQRDLRQQILETQQRLSDEIRDRSDVVLARLKQESADLRAGKADRVTLAALFTEIAMRLSHEPARSDQEPRRD
jgi:hypothetical protein